MAKAARKSSDSAPEAGTRARSTFSHAGWEQRALDQVMRGGRDRFLARSRKLVEAAGHLVADRGIDGLTLRALLDRTGLSRRAFYERFASKDDLLLAVFEHTIQVAADEYREAIAAIPGPLERLHYIVSSMIVDALSRRDIRICTAMSHEHLRLAEARPTELRHALRPFDELIGEQLAAGIAAGICRPLDVAETAALIHNVVSSTVHHALLADPAHGDAAKREAYTTRMASTVWEFCRRAVAAEAGARRTP